MTDLSYKDDFPFVRIMPESKAGETAFNAIAAHFDGGVIPVTAWPGTRAQLKQAGLSVRKRQPLKLALSDDDLLAELGLVS